MPENSEFMPGKPSKLEEILDYHRISKLDFGNYTPDSRHLDLEIQPALFIHYLKAPLLKLETEGAAAIEAETFPEYEQAFNPQEIPPADLNRKSISRLFFDSFALSAWRVSGDKKWPLRINPSTGNLHPTETYLLTGPVPELFEKPMVSHYSPSSHALEVRAELSSEVWNALNSGFPEGTVFIGLSLIHWRLAWKYGARAFRDSHLDAGHAIAALSFAAAGLGWKAAVLEDLGSEEIAFLLGISGREGPEKEYPVCLLAVYPAGAACKLRRVSSDVVPAFQKLAWKGLPSRLSSKHVEWVDIEKAAAASSKPETNYQLQKEPEETEPEKVKSEKVESEKETEVQFLKEPEKPSKSGKKPVYLRKVIHKRRSALEMNNSAYMEENVFYSILRKTLVKPGAFPFNALTFGPFAHLVLFVNRIKDLDSGLYILLRKSEKKSELKAALREEFLWEKPLNSPSDLEFYRLAEGDRNLQSFAAQLSCGQRKVADACFTACMLSEFEKPLKRFGPWLYPYLFWECGALGELLYLEAEASGFGGCGIGCFFDDPFHEMLGLKTPEFQDLYHFAVGAPLQEIGVTLLPAYES